MAGTRNIITDFTANEVSFVRKGANRKKFLITKSEASMNLEELLKSLNLDGVEGLDEALASIRKNYDSEDDLPEEAAVLMKAAASLAGKAQSMMKEGCGLSISGKGKHISVYKSEDMVPKSEAVLKADHEAELKVKSDEIAVLKSEGEILKQSVARFQKAVETVTDTALRVNLDRIAKGEEPMNAQLPPEAMEAIAKAETDKRQLEERIAKMEADIRDKELIAKAESFKNLPAAVKDKAVDLLKADPELGAAILGAVDTAMTERADAVTLEKGANGPGSGDKNPLEIAVIQKMDGDKTLTREQAVTAVLTERPELYNP